MLVFKTLEKMILAFKNLGFNGEIMMLPLFITENCNDS